MRSILEVGYCGLLIGHSNLRYFCTQLPPNVIYYGIDLPPEKTHSIEEFFMGLDESATYAGMIKALEHA